MKRYGFLLSLLSAILLLCAVDVAAQDYHRVTREEVSFSLMLGAEFFYFGGNSLAYYQATPYLYGIIGFTSVFRFFFYVPFQFTVSKTILDGAQIDWCGGIPSVQVGTQFTFYTTAINDVYVSLSVPVGVFSPFYFRNSETYSLSDGWFAIVVGYQASWIADPVLVYVNPALTVRYKNEAFYSNSTAWYHSYSLSCKTGFTEVLNGVFSYSVSVTAVFSLPTFKEFDGFVAAEIYAFSFVAQLGFSILLTEETRLNLSLSTPLAGYLQPTFEIYYTIASK